MRLFAYGGLTNWPFGDLMPGSFDFMMVDYPWHQKLYSEKGYKKAPQAHYRTMSLEEGMALPIMDLAAPNALIWVWAINPMLDKAFLMMSAWGFEFKTAGTWLKTTKNGKIHFGTGYILRGSNEPFLIGTRGKPKTTKSVRSGFTGLARKHSEKPEEAFAAAEKLMPRANRLELFSRTNRPGWQHWGDEVGKFDAEVAA
ncbi:MT-A70 family methyltransferase [Agrobacterium tumefaciens]|uniref:MT-A70 family methyltransferase n=1 Tax=Agrobacterium tumefaciens TaxID=358 RepID=UPI00157465C7|nr:MT-A70 family methyltransferase [Agrobacterium tumefaciens]NTD85451.1 DNA methyltransferase [Agrobacterium tumefaciens]NTD90800.1 DNA methyltransferase [Agrobacterium tumefaciens]NTD96403.1 DNA methyltransferase [Agrobacterium tumefaciens]NTE15874.1 DNA methyltransferase [Agrobacterium tumefaciens]NTE23137.1 DNA methyltransferase [Agrobacterium tumefaciens]